MIMMGAGTCYSRGGWSGVVVVRGGMFPLFLRFGGSFFFILGKGLVEGRWEYGLYIFKLSFVWAASQPRGTIPKLVH